MILAMRSTNRFTARAITFYDFKIAHGTCNHHRSTFNYLTQRT
jgi:hypothetical protein